MLFDKQLNRKPNHYPEVQQYINSIWASHWTPNEFDFQTDKVDYFVKLDTREREIISKSLVAISQIEVAVKKFWGQLGDNIPHPIFNDLGYVLANNEVIHNQAYEKLLMVLDLEDLFSQFLELEPLLGRNRYLKKYLEYNYEDNKQQYIYSVILFTLFIENVCLFSQFYIIMYFNRFKNFFRDTAQQVKYTRNEENLHAEVGFYLINKIREEYPHLFTDELIRRIQETAYHSLTYEANIIRWILEGYQDHNLDSNLLINYNAKRMKEGLQRIGMDTEEIAVDQDMLKRSKWFDEEVMAPTITDFFDSKPVEYNHEMGELFDEEEEW